MNYQIKIPKFRSAKRALSFATKYKTKLDDNSEKLIAKDAEYSWYYAEVIGSRFELGSSRTRISGFIASTVATATRRR